MKQIEWKFIDGTSIILTKKSSNDDFIKVNKLALKTLMGQYPSINNEDVVDDVIDFTEEYLQESDS